MRRSIDQAFLDLRHHISSWSSGAGDSGVYVFVYPPEYEAVMLDRFRQFAHDCEAAGWQVDIVDVGQGFLAYLDGYGDVADQLVAVERENGNRVLNDLNVLAGNYLSELLQTPPASPAVARILVNTGALAAFVSYSAICNALSYEETEQGGVSRNVIAFPGEGDERSLNLLGLRADTNYRLPRI